MAIHSGIDVSKNWCDFSALGADGIEDLRFSNDEDGFIRLRLHLCEKLRDAHICMESTGGYEKPLCSYLSRLGATVSVAEPRSVKRLGEALGVIHKTDKLDARLLAEYCKIVKPAPMVMEDPSKQDLSQLVNVWKDLEAQGLQVRNRLKNPLLPDAARQALEDTIGAIDNAMNRVKEAMDELIEGDEQLSQDCRLSVLLTSRTRFLLRAGSSHSGIRNQRERSGAIGHSLQQAFANDALHARPCCKDTLSAPPCLRRTTARPWQSQEGSHCGRDAEAGPRDLGNSRAPGAYDGAKLCPTT